MSHLKQGDKQKKVAHDDGFVNPSVAVNGEGQMWLVKGNHCIQVGGDIKRAIAKVTNLTLWI